MRNAKARALLLTPLASQNSDPSYHAAVKLHQTVTIRIQSSPEKCGGRIIARLRGNKSVCLTASAPVRIELKSSISKGASMRLPPLAKTFTNYGSPSYVFGGVI